MIEALWIVIAFTLIGGSAAAGVMQARKEDHYHKTRVARANFKVLERELGLDEYPFGRL